MEPLDIRCSDSIVSFGEHSYQDRLGATGDCSVGGCHILQEGVYIHTALLNESDLLNNSSAELCCINN